MPPPAVELGPVASGVGTQDPLTLATPPPPPDETDPTSPVYSNPRNPGGVGCRDNGLPVFCPDFLRDLNDQEGGAGFRLLYAANRTYHYERRTNNRYPGSITSHRGTDLGLIGENELGEVYAVQTDATRQVFYRVERFSVTTSTPWLSAYIGAVGAGQQQQNPIRVETEDPPPPFRPISDEEISRVRALIDEVLKKSLCAAFASEWLNELGSVTGVKPYSDSPLVLFDKIAERDSIMGTGESGVMGRASGSIGAGNARVGLNLNNIFKVHAAVGAAGVIHEVAHAAAGGVLPGYVYSHENMNRAAFAVLSRWGVIGPQGLLKSGPFGKFDPEFNYGGTALNRFCRR